MRIEGSVGERDIQHIRQGMPARVHVEAVGATPVEGTVEVVSPMVDPRTRTAKIRVTLDNSEGRLGAGMSARVDLELGTQQVVAVPDDTIERLGSGSEAALFVVGEGDVAERREVVLGARNGELVEIREGLVEGEIVVRGGSATVQDGEEVRIEGGREGTQE